MSDYINSESIPADTSDAEPVVNTDTSALSEPVEKVEAHSTLIFGKYKSLQEAEKGHKELESYLGKVKNESDQKVKQLESALQKAGCSQGDQAGYQNQAAYQQARMRLFNKYLPFSQNPNVSDVDALINSLPPAAAAGLGGELRGLAHEVKLQYSYEKNSRIQAFKAQNADFVKNPVNSDIMDFYFNRANAKPAEIMGFIDRVREDEKKKIMDNFNLQKQNDDAKKKLISEVTNGSQVLFSDENPPSLEQIRKMSSKEYLKYRDIVRNATQKGFYNRK